MANIFDRYGLKEVSNVSIFALDNDKKNGIKEGDLVLYLDSLKVSNIETTAEQVDARGGWGNPKLITWDYGKEISVTLEDALLSPEFLRIMQGGAIKPADETSIITRTSAIITGAPAAGFRDSYGVKVKEVPAEFHGINMTTGERITEASSIGDNDKIRIFWEEEKEVNTGIVEITISPSTFPGTYKFVGDTLVRSEETGKDSQYQWVVPKGKISSSVNFNMQAEGDPATFEMTINVLRATNKDGEYEMMKWIKYDIEDEDESEEEEP